MKITRIKTEIIKLELIKPVLVTFGVLTSVDTVIVKIETDSGLSGYGEASAFGPVTGETKDSVLSVIKQFERVLIGQNPLLIAEIHRQMDRVIAYNPSAKAGIDIALYDIFAKSLEVPLYMALGGNRATFESDKTISIGTVEKMVADVKGAMEEGFTKIKLKAGIDVHHDVSAMKAIRESCGDDLVIRMDANQGWNHIDAINAINEMAKYDLEVIEQPISYWDIQNLQEIRTKVTVPLMADESLHNGMDAIKLIKADAVDVFNIKLMKSSGIYGALKINHIAEAAGIECMVGCMAESPVGITAGAHFAAANQNVTRMDLDALFAIKKCDWAEGGVLYNGGRAQLSQEHGLGLKINF